MTKPINKEAGEVPFGGWIEEFRKKFANRGGLDLPILIEQAIDVPWEAEAIEDFISQLLTQRTEEVREQLRKEIEGMKKEKIQANFYANGGIRWNQGYNKCLSDVLEKLK